MPIHITEVAGAAFAGSYHYNHSASYSPFIKMLTFDIDFVLKQFAKLPSLTKVFEWIWSCGCKIVRQFCRWFFGMKYGTQKKELSDRIIEECDPLLEDLKNRLAEQVRAEKELAERQARLAKDVQDWDDLDEEELKAAALLNKEEVTHQLDAAVYNRETTEAELNALVSERTAAEQRASAERQLERDLALLEDSNRLAKEIQESVNYTELIEDCLVATAYENEMQNEIQKTYIQKKEWKKVVMSVRPGKEAALFERCADAIRCRHLVPGEEFSKIDEAARNASIQDLCAKYNMDTLTARKVMQYVLGLSCVPSQWELDNLCTAYSDRAMTRRAMVSDMRHRVCCMKPDF